jgi:hypothetical protein
MMDLGRFSTWMKANFASPLYAIRTPKKLKLIVAPKLGK